MVGGRDVVIAGGGIIGLSLAIELAGEGFAVTVVERNLCMRGASWAAAGMLAAEDPHHPAALISLAKLSRDLYPEYLARIERLSQMRVPLRTRVALLGSAGTLDAATIALLAPRLRHDNFSLVDEDSIDPRDLCVALPVAARSMGVELLEGCAFQGVKPSARHVEVATDAGELEAVFFVDCRGVASEGGVEPRKGQMVAVEWPVERLRCVVRTPEVYLVPRGDGRVVIGATVERGVSDTIVYAEEIERLVALADDLLPGIAEATRLESWAGVRPGTADDVPVMGATAEKNCFVASGHFRNGILLAPATARVMTQLICAAAGRGEAPSIALDAFSLARFHPLSR